MFLKEGFFSAENNKNEPITMRGHRLLLYHKADSLYRDASKTPFFPLVKNKIAKQVSEVVSKEMLGTVPGTPREWGKTPMQLEAFGEDGNGEKLYREELAETIYDFLTASENRSVKIVTEQIDDVCRLCRSGITDSGERLGAEHCKLPQGDEKWIEEYYGKNSEPSFSTTIGDLRKLFSSKASYY